MASKAPLYLATCYPVFTSIVYDITFLFCTQPSRNKKRGQNNSKSIELLLAFSVLDERVGRFRFFDYCCLLA
jgi:hypothetical protein